MPTDPKTGERLPYAGEPGAPEGAPPAPEEGAAKQEMIPERDMMPLAAEADELMLDDMFSKVGGALGPDEATRVDDAEIESEQAEFDTKPLEEMLNVSAERAAQIYAAAQLMPQMAGKSPTEVAEMLMGDMQLRMQIEKIAASTQDAEAEDATVDAAMKPEEGEPVGGPSLLGFSALAGAAAMAKKKGMRSRDTVPAAAAGSAGMAASRAMKAAKEK